MHSTKKKNKPIIFKLQATRLKMLYNPLTYGFLLSSLSTYAGGRAEADGNTEGKRRENATGGRRSADERRQSHGSSFG